MKQCYQFDEDNEGYTRKSDVETFIAKANIPKDKIIWCPFDEHNSNFVRCLKAHGYQVINSHINYNQDFYKYEPKNYDLIISNPPFKNKSRLIERLIELNKPFALIFGIQCFNTGKFNRLLNQVKRLQIVILEQRMRFIRHYDIDLIKDQPTFHSIGICNDIFDKDIQVWTKEN